MVDTRLAVVVVGKIDAVDVGVVLAAVDDGADEELESSFLANELFDTIILQKGSPVAGVMQS
jgi:hypothetical protein